MKAKKTYWIGIGLCVVLLFVIIGLIILFINIKTPPSDRLEMLPDKSDSITEKMEFTSAIDTQITDLPGGTITLAQLPADTKVHFLGYAENGYYKVKLGEVCGFVNGDYIIDSEMLKKRNDAKKVNMYVVNVEKSARIYEYADLSSIAIANASKGSQVTAYTGESENGFIHVSVNNTSGYIEDKFLSREAPLE